MSVEHPINQPIERVIVAHPAEWGTTMFSPGVDGVTRIEATTKSGMHADIPYVRVWAGERCVAEFCQHNIVAVFFSPVRP